MSRIIDLFGNRFGRLTAICRESVKRNKSPGTESMWYCICDCGNHTTVKLSCLRSGATKSCGCLQKEITIARSTKHGHNQIGKISGTYNSWRAMIERCSNPNNKQYLYYGGRGIRVCSKWRKFENFLEDMGERPDGLTLDRYPNNNGDYERNNCRWASRKEQANNRRIRREPAKTSQG